MIKYQISTGYKIIESDIAKFIAMLIVAPIKIQAQPIYDLTIINV
jgi:hypothetical protein